MNRQHARSRHLTLLLAVFLGWQPGPAAFAAEGHQDGSAEPAREEATGDRAPVDPEIVDPGSVEPPAERTTKPPPGGDPSVFVPSEEISEDFAVSFPVDI